MKRQKVAENEKICTLKVTLNDIVGRIKTKPYRILAIPGNFSLYRFAREIVHAFDFDFDHSFGFYNNFSKIFESSECYELFKDIEEEQGLEPTKCEGVKKQR